MNAPLRPADIAADLRTLAHGYRGGRGMIHLADELDALDARWPTADQIAVLRTDVAFLRAGGSWQFHSVGDRLAAFLDKLDPPQPEADDVVTLTVPVSVATAIAESITYRQVGSLRDALKPIARAALDARGQQ